jgi:hypothetical protein
MLEPYLRTDWLTGNWFALSEKPETDIGSSLNPMIFPAWACSIPDDPQASTKSSAGNNNLAIFVIWLK